MAQSTEEKSIFNSNALPLLSYLEIHFLFHLKLKIMMIYVVIL